MANTLDSLNVKIDHDEKAAFTRNTKELGTTPSNAIRMFVRAFNVRKGFPFDTSGPYSASPLETVDWDKRPHVSMNPKKGQYLPADFDDDADDDGLYDDIAQVG